jgi:hypothetical protein
MLDPNFTEALSRANSALFVKYGAAAALTLRPPGDMPTTRWVTFVSDVAAFLSSRFAGEADALGWGALDLFGADRDRPYVRPRRRALIARRQQDRRAERGHGGDHDAQRRSADIFQEATARLSEC